MSTAALLQTAISLHQGGMAADAEKAYRLTLQYEPKNADALALLGVLLSENKKHGEALQLIEKALALDPNAAIFHFHYGNALDKAGESARAEASMRKALALNPNWVDALYNLGNCLRAQKKNDDAVDAYRRCLAINPAHALARNNLGLLLAAAGKYAEGKTEIETGLSHNPDHVQLLLGLSDIAFENNDLPTAFAAATRVTEVKLGIKDGDIFSHMNAGGSFDTSDDMTRNCLLGLGVSQLLQGQKKEASAILRYLLSFEPDQSEVYASIGSIALADNNLDAAEEAYTQAFCLDPSNTVAPWNRAMALLTKGDFKHGFQCYRWRWNALEKFKRMALHAPMWNGSDPKGKTILVHEEQGFGDSLQMLRFLPLLRDKGARVYVYARPVLHALIDGWDGADKVLPWNVEDKSVPPDVDYVCGAMDLPGNLGISLGTIPSRVPYLPNPKKDDAAFALPETGFKVGLVWAGNPLHKRDHERSIPLDMLAPIIAMKGVRFYSMQYKPKDADKALMEKWGIIDLAPRIKNLADSAAQLAKLDLLITVDSAPAHLAGALGVPVWTLVTLNPDWRWLLGTDTSPWYPSLRLFRQASQNDWQAVISNVHNALAQKVNA